MSKRKLPRQELPWIGTHSNLQQCTYGQVNFDEKLLHDLDGFEKVNRLAVVLVQEKKNQILGMSKTGVGKV